MADLPSRNSSWRSFTPPDRGPQQRSFAAPERAPRIESRAPRFESRSFGGGNDRRAFSAPSAPRVAGPSGSQRFEARGGGSRSFGSVSRGDSGGGAVRERGSRGERGNRGRDR